MYDKIRALLAYIASISAFISAIHESLPKRYELISYGLVVLIVAVLFELVGEVKKIGGK